jgi:hypothetical protein
MSDRVVVCAGTRRGLFLFESNAKRREWRMRGPFCTGWEIYHAVVDTRRSPRVHAAGVSGTFATTTFCGDLQGKRFTASKKPPVPPKSLPSHEKFYKNWEISRAQRVWHIEPGRAREKGVLYAGTAPAGLFRTEDDGKTWEPLKGLNEHPTRAKWGPGAGGMCAHSIQLDPAEERRMYVGISSAGGFRTDDGGKTWKPINCGITAFQGGVLKAGDIGT